MIFETFPVGMLQCNCVILGCPATRAALVIDPGDEVERILEALRRHDLNLTGVLHTHAHFDHLGASAPLAEATGAPLLLHRGDESLYSRVPVQTALFGFPAPPLSPIDRYVRDGDALSWGDCAGEILHTPGHSPGSVCLHVPLGWGAHEPGSGPGQEPGRIFAGDTLFAGSIGRTDLWGGDGEEILRSIRRRLLSLPDETVVVPGHGPETTIGEERRRNPFLG